MSREYWDQWDKEELDDMHGVDKEYDIAMEYLEEHFSFNYKCEECSGCYECLAVI